MKDFRRFLVLGGAALMLIVTVAVLRIRKPEPPKPGIPPPVARSAAPAAAMTTEAPVNSAPQTLTIQGQVIDGRTQRPVGGARLYFHTPRPLRPGENLNLRLRANYGMNKGSIGSVGNYIKYGQDDRAYDRPQEGVEALGETTSDESGDFKITVPILNGIVECGHPDYVTAFGPFLDSMKDRKIVIRLFGGVLVRGRVLRADGDPVRQVLRIAMFGHDTGNWIGGGVWETETDQVGNYSIQVAAPFIFPKVQELGWRLEKPEAPVEVTPGMTLDLIGRRAPLLRVFEAVSRKPIERFSVMLGPPGSPGSYLRGEFTAPDGVLQLLYDTIDDKTYRGHFRIQVWTEGMAEFEAEIPDLLTSEDIQAAMVQGATPAAKGLVRRKGVPLDGARVSLNSGFLVTNSWKPESLSAVSSGSTAKDGAFKLNAPPGPYILLIQSESVTHAVQVQVPCDAGTIDLAELAEIHARVRDPQGKSLSGVVVLLQTEEGRRWKESSDAGGVARFTSIAPGELWIAPGTVFYPGANEYTNNAARWTRVQASPGQTTMTDLVIELKEPPRPLAVRFSIRGVPDLEGWKLTDTYSSEELHPDSVGFLTLSSRTAGIRIASPGGDTWWVHAPKDVKESWELEFDPEGPGFDGLLTDLATGRTLAGIQVQASGSRSLVSKTDSAGRFRLRGLEPGPHKLSFSSDSYSIGFEPTASPSADPPMLRVAIPRSLDRLAIEGFPNRKIRGQALNSGTLQAHATATIFSQSVMNVQGGRLVVSLKDSVTTTDMEGRFTLILPVMPTYRAQIVTRIGRPESRTYEREWTATGADDLVLDFKLP